MRQCIAGSIFYQPLKICVPVFCFLTGYFYYYNNDKSYSYSFRKITDILLEYWGVFFLFAVTAVMTVHYVYTPVDFIREMFALYRPTMIFCWYVYFYYLSMLILPLLSKLLSKNIRFDLFAAVVLFPMVLSTITRIVFDYPGDDVIKIISNIIRCFPTLLTGYLFAQYELFTKIERHYAKIISSKKFAVLLWITGVLFVPTFVFCVISTDVVYIPIFLFCLINLFRTIEAKYLRFVLKQTGKYSLLMWFVSCIFYNNSQTVFHKI